VIIVSFFFCFSFFSPFFFFLWIATFAIFLFSGSDPLPPPSLQPRIKMLSLQQVVPSQSPTACTQTTRFSNTLLRVPSGLSPRKAVCLSFSSPSSLLLFFCLLVVTKTHLWFHLLCSQEKEGVQSRWCLRGFATTSHVSKRASQKGS
jgi:hypothetical protein